MDILACQVQVPAITTVAQRDAHLDRIAGLMDRALAERRADLVVLPELNCLTYSEPCFDALAELGEGLEGPSFARVAPLAARHATTICYGLARRAGNGRHHICQAAVGPDGRLLGHYDKLHIAATEKPYFDPGAGLLVFEVAGWRVAPIICYDLRFAGLCRRLARDEGVELILHPNAFYRDETFPTWHPFAVTRALENQIYFLSLNRAGAGWGQSILVPPGGETDNPSYGFGEAEELRYLQITRADLAAAREDYSLRRDDRGDYQQFPVSGAGPGRATLSRAR